MVKVIVYVEGGVVVGARADNKNVEVDVFDFDNEEAEGLTSKESQTKAKKLSKEYPYEIF